MNLRLPARLSGLMLILMVLCLQMQAQEKSGLRERAEKFFNEVQYSKAAALYQILTDTPNARLEDMEHLAICYKKMNNYADAEIWYSRIVKYPDSKIENLFNYGEILKANASYVKAKEVLQQYLLKMPRDKKKKVQISIAGCDSAMLWISNPTEYTIRNEATINTPVSEFSAFPLENHRVCFTGETPGSVKGRKYGWTGRSFLRMYLSRRSEIDDSLSERKNMSLHLNRGLHHIGPVSTNHAGDLYLITRSHFGRASKVTKIEGKKYRTRNMELFLQRKVGGKWHAPDYFAYNDVKKYSVGHGAISKNGEILYFVSDMPGGQGGADIWYTERQKDGQWGVCKNIGTSINTPGDELFPMMMSNDTLYFSSDGHPGMGGLDIYYSVKAGWRWSAPVNLKYPINSPGDDFSISFTDACNKHESGYLSSNRANGKGGDDIYSFKYQNKENLQIIAGTVFDKRTYEVMPGSMVTLYDMNQSMVARQESGPDGTFMFQLGKPGNYRLKGTKAGYYPDTARLEPQDFTNGKSQNISLYLDSLEKGKTFVLENIHYDFDKDNIRRDAAIILDGLVTIMHENPTLVIELSSHTDCRGTDKYNIDLSQRRAQSAVNYLVSHGIARARMVAKGYGETRLVNRCKDGVPCTPAEHQQNRRTEFTVLSF